MLYLLINKIANQFLETTLPINLNTLPILSHVWVLGIIKGGANREITFPFRFRILSEVRKV